jgi:hypothetical protein
MKRFFRVDHSTNEQEIGLTFPQSQKARIAGSVDDPRALSQQAIGKPLPSDVLLPEPEVHRKAIVTDLISCVATGMRPILSPTLINIFEKYSSPNDIEFVPITIWKNNKKLEYWLSNPLIFKMDAINYAASEIWLADFGFSKLEKLHIQNESAYVDTAKSLQRPKALLINIVKIRENTTTDFFHLINVVSGIGYYVSEIVKNEIEKAGCTGVSFVEI